MSNPTGWSTPKVDWDQDDGITEVDLDRIETNILGLRDWLIQGGNFQVTTVNLPGGEKTGTVYWEKHAQGLVCLRLPELLGTSAAGNNISLQLSPTATWPTAILIAFNEIYVPALVNQSGPQPPVLPTYIVGGRIEIPYEANTNVKLHCLTTNDNLFDANCGIIEQFISYYTTDSTYTTTPAP